MNENTSVLLLMNPPDDVNPIIPNRIQGALSSDQGEPNVTDEINFERWKSTVSATAKLFLQGAKEAADAFPPLKSVIGGLCFILDNFEVWRSSCTHYPQSSRVHLANEGE